MKSCYIISPEIKFIPQLSLVILHDSKIHLKSIETLGLKESLKRPLFQNDLLLFRRKTVRLCFKKLPFKITHPNELAGPGSCLTLTSKKNAQYLKIDVIKKTRLNWETKHILLPRGEYMVPFFFPLSMTGKFQKSYWKDTSIVEMRENWFLEKIKKFKPTRILELGSGKNPRLGKMILEKFPKLKYQGWDKNLDKEYEKSRYFQKKDFLKSPIPNHKDYMIIAHEVIEHLPEIKTLPLIKKLLKTGASVICITTPNADFNPVIKVDKRRADHQFEWNRKEIELWSNKLESTSNCSVSIERIGKIIKKATPTWAVTIQKQ